MGCQRWVVRAASARWHEVPMPNPIFALFCMQNSRNLVQGARAMWHDRATCYPALLLLLTSSGLAWLARATWQDPAELVALWFI